MAGNEETKRSWMGLERGGCVDDSNEINRGSVAVDFVCLHVSTRILPIIMGADDLNPIIGQHSAHSDCQASMLQGFRLTSTHPQTTMLVISVIVSSLGAMAVMGFGLLVHFISWLCCATVFNFPIS